MYVDLGWILAVLFYIVWAVLGGLILYIIFKNKDGDSAGDTILKIIASGFIFTVFLLTILVYGGIFWW